LIAEETFDVDPTLTTSDGDKKPLGIRSRNLNYYVLREVQKHEGAVNAIGKEITQAKRKIAEMETKLVEIGR
jgi:hypothetical protein